MADIDVTFGAPGAANAARDADRFAASTAKGGAAAQRASVTGKAHSATLRESSIAARAAARAQQELGEATDRHAKSQINLRQAFRLGGLGKLGRIGGALQGGGGATAAVGLSLLAAHTAVNALVGALHRSIDAIKAEVEGRHALDEAIKSAREEIGHTGQKSADELGGTIKDVIGRFGPEGLESAQKLSEGSGMQPKDVMQAMLESDKLHPRNSMDWMKQVLDAARINGTSASEEMKKTGHYGDDVVNHGQDVTNALVGEHRGRVVDGDFQVNPAGERILRNQITQDIETHERYKAKIGWSGVDMIKNAPSATAMDLADAKDPVSAAIRKLHDKAQEQVNLLQQIRNRMSPAVRAVDDAMFFTRGVGTHSVRNDLNNAVDNLNNLGGLPSAPVP